MAGRFVWWDLMTVDIEKSAAFFATLLDCDILQPEDEPSYLMLAPRDTEEPVFGLIPISAEEGVTSHWMGYVAVPNVSETLEKVTELGGTVTLGTDELSSEEAEALPVKFSIIQDPQGSVLAVMQAESTEAAGDAEVPGLSKVAWIELLAGSRAAAVPFYQGLFGWDVGPEHARPDEGMAHALFEAGEAGRLFGLLRDQPRGSPMPPHWAYFLRVPDLDQAIVTARELGGFIFEDPAPVDGGRRVILLDPTGAPVCLWQLGA